MEKRFLKKFDNDKSYRKRKDHCHLTGKYRGAADSIFNLRFNVLNEIPAVFQNGSKYDIHFIMKELAKEFEGQVEYFGENTEKCKTFSVPIEKELTSIDEDSYESVVTMSYKINFIDSARFMVILLSNFVDNVTKGIHSIKCEVVIVFLNMKVLRII